MASGDRALVRELIAQCEAAAVPIAVTSEPAEARAVIDQHADAACILDAELAGECLGRSTEAGAIWLACPVDPEGGARELISYPRSARGRAPRDIARCFLVRSPDAADRRILGVSVHAVQLRDQVRRVARYPDLSVLIVGATGTGKELVAETVHRLTHGSEAPFVAVNCAALPEQLVESELFGHEAGAFTGARQARVGLMEAAAGGTLFLDEIGEMPLPLQSKLLRALETRSFRPVGGNRSVRLTARIVSATNRSLDLPRDPSLRDDLYYRLAGFTIRLPSLRRRAVDVAVLARHFLEQFESRYGRLGAELSDDAVDVLERCAWRGNCRELRAVVEHAAISAPDGRVCAPHVRLAMESRHALMASSIPPAPAPAAPRAASAPPPTRLEDMERMMITRAMAECDGNVSRAAQRLGIPRSTLRDKLRRHGL